MHVNKSKAASLLLLLNIVLGMLWLTLGSILAVAGGILPRDVYGLKLASQYIPFIVGQFPGVPLPMGELINQGAPVIGVSIAILGLDILLVGLGLWVRHKLARWIAIAIFGLAAYFDFTQFLLLGLLGAFGPTMEALVNSLIAYMLLKHDNWFGE